MICPLLTYADMQKAMAELAEVFELQIVWFGDDVAEIRWNGGVAVAQKISQRPCTAATSARAGPTYESPTPMRTTRPRSTVAVRSSTNHTLTRRRAARIQRPRSRGQQLDLRIPRVRQLTDALLIRHDLLIFVLSGGKSEPPASHLAEALTGRIPEPGDLHTGTRSRRRQPSRKYSALSALRRQPDRV